MQWYRRGFFERGFNIISLAHNYLVVSVCGMYTHFYLNSLHKKKDSLLEQGKKGSKCVAFKMGFSEKEKGTEARLEHLNQKEPWVIKRSSFNHESTQRCSLLRGFLFSGHSNRTSLSFERETKWKFVIGCNISCFVYIFSFVSCFSS